MEKIILGVYLNVGNIPPKDVDGFVHKVIDQIKNDDVITYVMPVRDEPTKIEILNPRLVSEYEYKTAAEVLERYQKEVDRIINWHTNNE